MPNLPKHPLKILVVGSGGREHALCWKIAQSPLVEQVFCAPGNGGTVSELKTKNVPIESSDFANLVKFCQDEKIDFTVIGPENRLAEGIADYFLEKELKIFGPTKSAARLEWSKAFAKEFMGRNNIPTAKFKICTNYDDALQTVKTEPWALVVKVDGLVFGKGVYVCEDSLEAEKAINEIFKDNKFGDAGKTVVLEEKLNGEEVSLFLLSDGKIFLPMAASQDNKRRFDNDRGPNTGGMGAISPPAIYEKYEKMVQQTIIEPLLKALQREAINYQGVIYPGIILHQDKETGTIQPKILEFNSRFGDPETQIVLPRLQSDLLPALWACAEGTLSDVKLDWKKEAGCCVVAVNKDYPAKSSKDEPITIDTKNQPKDIVVFHAGTKIVNNKLVTAGGRMLAISALGKDIQAAADRVYDYLPNISFKDIEYRKDIGRSKSGISSRK